jgi:glutathione synthase/RimK-type ligase-like ATP-grasp enzyme
VTNNANSFSAPAYLGLAKLMRLSLTGADLRPLAADIIARASADETLTFPLLDAAIIFEILGNPAMANQLQQMALQKQRLYRIPSSKPPRLRLLALVAPGNLMANVPIECLLENADDIELTLWYVTGNDDLTQTPAHDVLFVAIGEMDDHLPLLAAWEDRLATWPKPVLNRPRDIVKVARDSAARLLGHLPGIQMPPTYRVHGQQLRGFVDAQTGTSALPEDLRFPLIVRPIDSHAGQQLHRLDDASSLLAMLATGEQNNEFFVSNYIDYRNADGLFRKYRLVLIEGRPFPCHLAISSHWMIHYLNAGMAESAEKRAEEADFMVNFSAFAARHAQALKAIQQAFGLDYLGIDFAETTNGDLLIFEVDPAMVVHAMDPVEVFPYKQASIRQLFTAFREMLFRAAEKGRADA